MPATIVIVEYLAGEQQKTLPVEGWTETASQIAGIPGLQWKYWLLGEGDMRGGVYLFSDRERAETASAHLIDSLVASGARDANRRLFDVEQVLSAITRGTLTAPSP